jgi:hypothetical protein
MYCFGQMRERGHSHQCGTVWCGALGWEETVGSKSLDCGGRCGCRATPWRCCSGQQSSTILRYQPAKA